MQPDPPFVTISRAFSFEAAHCLPKHEGGAGKCARPHGHSYEGEVTIHGPMQMTGDEEGMVVDFGKLGSITDALDHRDLNVELAHIGPTTAENLAIYLCDQFYEIAQSAAVAAGVSEKDRRGGILVCVSLKETKRSTVEVSLP